MASNDDIKKAFKAGYAKGYAKVSKPAKGSLEKMDSCAKKAMLKYLEDAEKQVKKTPNACKMLSKYSKATAKTICDHEEMLSNGLKKTALKLKNMDVPMSVSNPKMPPRKIQPKRYEVYRKGYNPARVYNYQQMWQMDMPKANGLIEKEPHFFDCSICTFTRCHVELAFECCVLVCKRQYCKTCYPFSTTHPKCHGCDKYFCAMCMIRYECAGCGVFMCSGCHKRHEKLCADHLCIGPCCSHNYSFKSEHLHFISQEEENYDGGKKMMTQKEMDEKDFVIKRFIQEAAAEKMKDK